MMSGASQTLWIDESRPLFFLIPNQHNARSGSLMLSTFRGDRKAFDPDAVASYQVTPQEADAWLAAQRGPELNKAKQAVDAFLTGGAEPESSPAQTPVGPGARLFSALTGESADAIATDPATLARGLRKFGGDLQAIVADAFSADASKRETAKQRMQDMQDLARQHGLRKPADACEERQHAAGAPEADAKPDPGEVFRQRLHTILKDAVGRLESLADEVLPMDKDKPDGGSGASNRT